MMKRIAKKLFRKARSEVGSFPLNKPVFIIAPPRSGSTFLFECLRRFSGTVSLPREADHIWWELFPYERRWPPTDRVYPSELTKQKIGDIRRQHYLRAINSRSLEFKDGKSIWQNLGIQPIRYLDKTIANCLRVDTLIEIFPDAEFVFLVRDPRPNISSMIEGWSHFDKPQLDSVVQSVEDSSVDCWTYPAPPGWQDIIDLELPEICAWTWRQHVEHALSGLDDVSPVHWVRYEELRDNPSGVIERLSNVLSLEWNKYVQGFLRDSPNSRTTVSDPEKGKWERKNKEEVRSILNKISKTSKKLGYEV